MPSNFIPQGGPPNPMVMMQQFQKFKQDYLAQNPNPDPKGAVMQILTQNGMDANSFIQQGSQLYNSVMPRR